MNDMNDINDMNKLGRRKFLKQSSCAAIGTTTLFSTLFNLKTMNAASISNSAVFGGGGYKALVCIYMGGGNDSFNMLMPKQDNNEYNIYAESRSNQAIPQADILALSGSDYGLHPMLTNIRDMYDQGDVAFVTNVGTLIEPVDQASYYDGSAALPLGLYSHADQSQQWQTSVPHDRTAVGWGGKIADLLQSQNTNQDISLNVSLAGNNVFQTGNTTSEFTVNPTSGAILINGYGDPWLFSQLRTQAIDDMIEANYQDLFKKTYMDIVKVSRDANIQYADAIENVTLNTVFSDNPLSTRLELVAKTIAARDTLGMTRQIFFVDFGSWDHHDELLNAQAEQFDWMNLGLLEFREAMNELATFDCVTTFSLSEFSRTLSSNGNGTDHGWGANVFMMGGEVIGGNIYGNYPNLELGSNIDVGGGVLIPEISCDEYFAELSRWFGVTPSELSTIFPNIGNFYDVNSSENPIGFLPFV